MDHREIGWGSINWIDLDQSREQQRGSCEHDDEPSGPIRHWEFFE
jgi:hypothetical protein